MHFTNKTGIYSLMRNKNRSLLVSLVFIGLLFALDSQACTTDGWSNDNGIPPGIAGSPADTPPISRYSEFCGLALTEAGYVQSNFANTADARYIGRFYVYANGAGAVDVLVAYSDETGTSDLFTISKDGINFVFDSVAGGDAIVEGKTGWNLIEFDYSSGGDFVVWVNGTWNFDTLVYDSAPSATFSAGAGGNVDSVRLGMPNGEGTFGGTAYFDAYEAHRTTPVGALLAGDANNNDSINVFDMISIQNEILDPQNKLASGQPDCNGNGSVNVFDMICVQNIILQ